jgi:thymidylate synthase
MRLQNDLLAILRKHGKTEIVKGKKMKELYGQSFFVTSYDYILNKNKMDYVYNKITTYRYNILQVIKKLEKDKQTRQAMLMFNLNGNKPNCIVSIQFMIRKSELHVFVYSRSLDVKKRLLQDIEIVKRMSDIVSKYFVINTKSIRFFVGNMHYYV